MSGARRVRRFLSGMLALTLVAVVAYGAAALLSPLPQLEITQTFTVAANAEVAESWGSGLPLPEAGSTAVEAEGATPVLGGSIEPRPIAGTAKLILAHVVLATEPLQVGSPGAAITIDQAAIDRYRELDAAGARTVTVQFGETWTRRDLIAATLIGSGNNTAELLVNSVFGGADAYRTAARTWLDGQGLADTTVVDGSGLDSASRSTAADLVAVARLTLNDPVLADLFEQRPRETAAGVGFADESGFLRDLGTIGLSRSYTDPAGVCALFAITVADQTIVIAMLGQPGYPTAETSASEIIAAVREAVRDVNIITAGQTIGVAQSDWGQASDIIAVNGITVSSTELENLDVQIDANARSTLVAGIDVGSLTVAAGGREQVVRLESTAGIAEPGVAWRFADPVTVIQRWTR